MYDGDIHYQKPVGGDVLGGSRSQLYPIISVYDLYNLYLLSKLNKSLFIISLKSLHISLFHYLYD
jgi:hypothetical protein